jgi:hypothetical protein
MGELYTDAADLKRVAKETGYLSDELDTVGEFGWLTEVT